MKKHNNQGFTLIEMLMVVAVIAVLVSIIVPQVSNASDRAAAAADAANLRSAQTAITTKILEGDIRDTYTADELGIPENPNCKGTYEVTGKDEKPEKFECNVTEGEISVSYGKFTIAMLSDIADNGKLDHSNAANPQETEPKKPG